MIELIQGDITSENVDAIVNAANTKLLGGGGVDGAIHRAAGKELLKECKNLNGCPTGEARITKGYNLKAKWVIHTVGPVWNGGTRDEESLLTQCYINSFALVLEYKINSVAFPAISTGVYHFPISLAAEIAHHQGVQFHSKHPDKLIRYVCFDNENFEAYQKLTC